MRNPFRRNPEASVHPKNDAGTGSLKDYGYDLVASNRNVTMQLAESDQHQDVLAPLADRDAVEVFVARRTMEEERTDAPVQARLFADGRVTGVVGLVPRGLEPVIFEAVTRLESSGKSTRLPAVITPTKNGLRVTVLMGKLR